MNPIGEVNAAAAAAADDDDDASATVTIHVDDVNDHTPHVVKSLYRSTMSETVSFTIQRLCLSLIHI